MKIRKILLISLIASSLLLGGCKKKKPTSESEPSTPSEPQSTEVSESVPAGTTVDTYLVLGEIGLYKGQKGQSYPDFYIENAVKFTAKVGDNLPGKADVTTIPSSTGEFVSWVRYEGTGAPVKYTKVPNQKNTILYAYYSDTGDVSSEPSEPSEPSTPSEAGDYTYTVTDMPTWVRDDGCVIFAWVWSDENLGSWKSLEYTSDTSATFKVSGLELNGFLLARCFAGTTAPDWNVKGDKVGRIYNQTNNIDCVSGQYTYACSSWKSYTPV